MLWFHGFVIDLNFKSRNGREGSNIGYEIHGITIVSPGLLLVCNL